MPRNCSLKLLLHAASSILSYMLQSTCPAVLMTAAPSSPDPAADNLTVAPAPAQVGWRSSRALDSMCAL